MIGTGTQIKYIQRDEIQHCNIFKNIILEIKRENPDVWERNEEVVKEMFNEAVRQEIAFTHDTIGDNILGMSKDSTVEYTHNLANRRLKDIKMEQIFPKSANPYKHLELIASVEDETTNRANNFEITSTQYKNPSILSGWDKIKAKIKYKKI